MCFYVSSCLFLPFSLPLPSDCVITLESLHHHSSFYDPITATTAIPTQELDEAARRRFVKRLYIPLPDVAGRQQLLETLLATSHHQLNLADLQRLIAKTDGFSGADIRSLCTEAALGPVREVASRCRGSLASVRECDVPAITMTHFEEALQGVAASVSQSDLQRYIDWNTSFGSYRRMS